MSLMVFNRQEFELGKYVPCYCSYMNKIIQFYNKCKLSFSLTSKTTSFQKENYLIVQLNKAIVFHLKIKIKSTNKDIIRKQLVISKDSLESVNINEDTSEKK